MKSPAVTLVCAATVFAAISVTSLRAQTGPRRAVVPISLLTIAIHDLEFPDVLPGVPKTVSVHDPAHSALFEIQGQPNASVRVELVLPAALTSSGGAVLPVAFGAGDGFVGYTRSDAPPGHAFNPQMPLITTLSGTGQLYVRLGGTALPGRPQSGGIYRATIILTVYDLGT